MQKQKDGSHREDVSAWRGITSAPVCCYTCDKYSTITGHCNEFDDEPPEDFKEWGCGEWQEGIPF